jgi:hypothetical protein
MKQKKQQSSKSTCKGKKNNFSYSRKRQLHNWRFFLHHHLLFIEAES